jgi:hypothetical protein
MNDQEFADDCLKIWIQALAEIPGWIDTFEAKRPELWHLLYMDHAGLRWPLSPEYDPDWLITPWPCWLSPNCAGDTEAQIDKHFGSDKSRIAKLATLAVATRAAIACVRKFKGTSDATRNGMQAARMIIIAKGFSPHGWFLPWLAICGLNRMTASRYMRLAKDHISDDGKLLLPSKTIHQAWVASGIVKPKRRPIKGSAALNPPQPAG